MCYNPISIQLRKQIELPGGKEWVFKETTNGRYLTHVNVGCGKCAKCIDRSKAEIAFRAEMEMRLSKTAYFVTLTYDNNNVPYDKWGNKILEKNHLQKYLKRLRIAQQRYKGHMTKETYYYGLNLKKDKLSFIGCGEYGHQRGRPHYHLIIFNGCKKIIESEWGAGEVWCEWAGPGSINYVVKYMDKKRGHRTDNWKVPKEFRVNSTNMGLEYIEKMGKWHRKNPEVMYCHNGKFMVPMSRYYREKIWSDENEREKQTLALIESLESEKRELIKKIGQDRYNNKIKQEEYNRSHKAKKKEQKRKDW